MTRSERLRLWFGTDAPREFGRFAAVGVAGTAVHYGVMIALKELAGVGVLLSTLCGFLLAAVVSYTLNRRYTFAAQPTYSSGLAKFVVVTGVGAALNVAIVALLINLGLYYIFAQMVATSLVLIWNFVGARLIVFRA